MTTYAVLSTTSNHDYDFYAPITARLWSEIVGYRPIVIVVGPASGQTRRLSLVELECVSIGAMVAFQTHSERVSAAHEAQVSRLFAYTLPHLKADHILMTADVDMWPLQRDYFQIMDAGKMNLYGSNVYKGDRHPMCYAAARVDLWREMLGLQPHTTMAEALAGVKWNGWDTDEDTLQRAIEKIGGKAACALKRREGSRHGYMGNRVDRGRWIYDGPEQPALIDAHLPRPGFPDETWPRVRRLIEDYCPQIVSWADDYRMRYLAAFDK